MNQQPTLIVITGPTGVGKTATAIAVAKALGTDISSADSRQIYREIPIGTAAPTAEQMAAVPHHFVQFKNLDEYYSAAQFEDDVMQLLPRLFNSSAYAVMCGGSMMYVDAVCRGIDDIPTISPEIRNHLMERYERDGIESLRISLLGYDPEYYRMVDLNNHRRIIHALEICLQAGVPYSSLRTGDAKKRPFEIVKIALNMPREQLFDRINRRVDAMMLEGLEQEARKVYPLRHLNSLNTVGFKEMFAYFDGTLSRDTAIERIKKNTRVYAKKQLTWFAKDSQIIWCEPSADAVASIIRF